MPSASMATSTSRSTWPSSVPNSPVARSRGQEVVPEQQEAGGNRRAGQRRHREKGVLSDRGVEILHVFACPHLRVHRRGEDDRGEQCGEKNGSYQSAIHGASEGG